MSTKSSGELVTVPRRTLENIAATLEDSTIPFDMAAAAAVTEINRLLGITPETFEIDDLLYATELEQDRTRGF